MHKRSRQAHRIHYGSAANDENKGMAIHPVFEEEPHKPIHEREVILSVLPSWHTLRHRHQFELSRMRCEVVANLL
jgi:hypothetical protein